MFIPAAGFLAGSLLVLAATVATRLYQLAYAAITKDSRKAAQPPHIHIGIRYAVSLFCAALAICVTLANVFIWKGTFLQTKARCKEVSLDFETYQEYGLSDRDLELYATAVQLNHRLKALQSSGWMECIGERELVRGLEPIDLSNFSNTTN